MWVGVNLIRLIFDNKPLMVDSETICVMIFDIIRSSEIQIKLRSEIQLFLENFLLNINEKFDDYIFSKFMITLGDEFEGALVDQSISFDIYLYGKKELNIPVRCGIGIGQIIPMINREKARQLRVVELDGPAFHRARKALINAEKNNLELVINTGNINFDKNFNAISKLLQTIKSKWTNRQKEYINFIRQYKNEINISDSAKHFNVTKQAVSKALISANFYTVIEAENHLKKLLSQPSEVDFMESILKG